VITNTASVPARAGCPSLAEATTNPRFAGAGTSVSTELPGALLKPRGRNSGDRHQRRSPGTWPANACDAPAAAAVAADLGASRQRSLLDLEGKALRLDHSVACCHTLRRAGAGLLALSGPAQARWVCCTFFLYAKAGRLEIHRIPRALQDLGCGFDDSRRCAPEGRQTVQDLPEGNNRLRPHHEQRWAQTQHGCQNFRGQCTSIPRDEVRPRRLFRFVEGSGLTSPDSPTRSMDSGRRLSAGGKLLVSALAA